MKNIIFGKLSSKIAMMLLVCMTLSVYANSLKNSFVWDDFSIIVNNGFVKSWDNFPRLFDKSYLTKYSDINDFLEYRNGLDLGSGEFSYRPVVSASYFLDFSIWQLDPFGYHLTNLILHILNTLLLFIFIGLITKNKTIALLASLLFALHPVNTEAVNVISFREDLLVFLFFILTFIFYIKSTAASRAKAIILYIISLVMFLLALFSKEMAVSFPAALVCYDYFFNKIHKGKEMFVHFRNYYLGYIGVLVFYFLVSFILMNNPGNLTAEYQFSNFYTNIFTMSKVFATYFQWLIFPFNIHPVWQNDVYLIARSLFDPGVIISIALIVSILIFTVKIHKKFPIAAFASFWFFITIIPVSNIIPTLINYMAARYLYLPTAGFCLATAFFLIKLPDSGLFRINTLILRKISVDTIIILLVFYSIFTVNSNMIFKNNTVFWLNMTEIYPRSASMHFSLGACFLKNGELDKAITEFQTAANLAPRDAKTHNSLGVCYRRKGIMSKATDEFKQALQLNPAYTTAYTNLGNISAEQGLYPEAIKYFRKAIQLDKKYLTAYTGLSYVYVELKEYKQIKELWDQAIRSGLDHNGVKAHLDKLKQLGIYW